MKLHEIFIKRVDRPIEGVIKADDLTGLQTEVEEYVITNEISKSLDIFFGAYNDYVNANGVWISGFFGSGKSHLLKMLALLLENQVINGQPAIDYFTPKCQDAMLKAEMQRAVTKPSTSILFNIDQKADTISKKEVDAVLAVFVKVFNEMQGYYGKHGYVAQFERDLDARGLYDDFKVAYETLAGIDWDAGREQIILEKANIAKAYAQVSGGVAETHRNIIDAYREDYKLSIEDFAVQVDDYIQKQAPGFRLNFFVDEVGQYIANNIKLMTNLQTIAESLATKCKGQAWIIVTAQEDMQSVLGDMGQQQSNDFSKIQDRFKTRVKLTSQNVGEVIQKRLLSKTSQGETLAGTLYQQQKNNFGTLFDFSDGATTYRKFSNEKHFIDSYPFIPYQFTLFQTSIETLSQHSAFEGKHSSVGERSMLGVFQEVAISICEKEVGELATFDLMYEGIQAALKTQIQRSILVAKNELGDIFALRVLKALLLVKYVKGFNATPRNLRVLLQENFTQDIPTLRKEIEAALTLLEQQTYIQRNGEVYEYLTDEEKDVEQEIKNTQVDSTEVADTLQKVLFDGIVKERKIRYEETGQDFLYTRKMDDRTFNREQELAIHFVTSFNDNIENMDILKANSLGRPELMVVLPPDARLRQDLVLYEQTKKYVPLNRTTTQVETVRMILDNKAFQNTERFRLIQDHIQALVSKARFFVGGSEIEISGEDHKSRIVKGFNELVVSTYPNLRMLRGFNYSEDHIKRHLEFSKKAMIDSPLTEPDQEVLSFIQRDKNIGARTTMKSLEDHFTRKPYGWYLAALQCIVAILNGRGKIEVRSDSDILEDADLERALRNTHIFPNLIIEPFATVSPQKVKQLKDFHNDFFDRPATGNDGRSLGREIGEGFRELLSQLEGLAMLRGSYPFLAALEAPIQTIQGFVGKPYTYFLEELLSQEDALLDMKEDILDPIRRFMSGTNRSIYDEALQFLRLQSDNFNAIGNGKPAQLREILNAPDCYRGNQMRTVKSLMDALRVEIEAHVQVERDQADGVVQNLQERLHAMDEFICLSDEQRQTLDENFAVFQRVINQQISIPVIRDAQRRFEQETYTQLLTEMSTWVQQAQAPEPGKAIREAPVAYITRQSLQVPFSKAYLTDEADVDEYLAMLREAMLHAVKENKRISL